MSATLCQAGVMDELPLESFGLVTIDEFAARMGCSVRAAQKWVADGLIPAVRVVTGRHGVYLLREADVKNFTPPPRGRPPKVEKPAPKKKGKKK